MSELLRTRKLARRRIALLVEYDGAELSGSQLQSGQRTVQGELEAAVEAYDSPPAAVGEPAPERRRVAFAGRTDAGVHARGQVAAIEIARGDNLATVRDALNFYLPADVAVLAAAEVGPTFEPRHDARARRYSYRIADGRPRSPLSRRDRWQRTGALDERAMAAAAALLPRTEHDWSPFAGPLEAGRSPLRTLLHLTVERLGPHELQVTMEANAFLPHQVRRVVGALERVGAGALTPADLALLAEGEPGSAGPTAPPHGLTLEGVRYEPGVLQWGAAIRGTALRGTALADADGTLGAAETLTPTLGTAGTTRAAAALGVVRAPVTSRRVEREMVT